jgi:hypothetical protein
MEIDASLASAVSQTYYDAVAAGTEGDWAAFTAGLTERAETAGVSPETVAAFVDELETNNSNPMNAIATMCAVDDRRVDGVPEVDAHAWNGFLAECGPRWDGQESSWAQFREWFLYEAAQRGVADPAGEFIRYAESHGDKVAVFAQYGIAVARGGDGAEAPVEAPVAEPAGFPVVQLGDSGEWVQYLDDMLTSKGF